MNIDEEKQKMLFSEACFVLGSFGLRVACFINNGYTAAWQLEHRDIPILFLLLSKHGH